MKFGLKFVAQSKFYFVKRIAKQRDRAMIAADTTNQMIPNTKAGSKTEQCFANAVASEPSMVWKTVLLIMFKSDTADAIVPMNRIRYCVYLPSWYQIAKARRAARQSDMTNVMIDPAQKQVTAKIKPTTPAIILELLWENPVVRRIHPITELPIYPAGTIAQYQPPENLVRPDSSMLISIECTLPPVSQH